MQSNKRVTVSQLTVQYNIGAERPIKNAQFIIPRHEWGMSSDDHTEFHFFQEKQESAVAVGEGMKTIDTGELEKKHCLV